MTATRTEWAARFNPYEGGEKYENAGGDREHAEFTVDSVATYLASLNDATREHGGFRSVDLVSREVTVEDDGTQIIRPWAVVRTGCPRRRGQ